jgi:glycosyltransferase involved in cell wall biosynthesis
MTKSSINPLFSVVIPTRNRPIDFKKALDSVLSQSYQALEVIVVNDGTNTQHRDAYNQLEAEKPNNVTYINLIERTRGHGHCFARNQGVDIAKGKFICFLDDDDWWIDSEFLSRAAEELTNSDADFYFANQKAVTHESIHVPNVWVENLPETLPKNDPRLKQSVFPVTVSEMLNATGFPHQNCWVIATKLYNRIDGMDENLRYEPDRDIYLRALDKANGLIYDANVVALHNIPDNSKKNNASTLTSNKQKLLFQLRTVEKGILFSEKTEISKFCIKRKGYILKKLTEILAKEKNHKLAFLYAKEALGVSFTFKWLLFTKLCALKALLN